MTQRTYLRNRLTAIESRPEAGFLSPILQVKTLKRLSPLCALPSSPSPLPSPAFQHQCPPHALRRPMHIAGLSNSLPASTPSLHRAPSSEGCAWMDTWPQQLLRSHRALQNAPFLGGCSLETKHHCGQAAGGRGAPTEESKRAKVPLLVVPPQVNQSASLHQMG